MKNKKILNDFTILYVEDEDDILDQIVGILKLFFKNVYTAKNGEDGLEKYKQYKPDIVLTDVYMPIQDGIKMSENIKKINPYQKIALFTAFDSTKYFKKALDVGISKYILKPLNQDQFFRALIEMAEEIKAEQDMKKMQQMLEVQSKLASMGEMIENIAHQWRQPLNMITLYVSSMELKSSLQEEITNEQIYNCARKVNEQAELLTQTIEDFRSFYKDTSSTFQEFDISDTIQKVISLTRDAFKSNSINIIFKPQKIILKQNQNKLIQVFLNIFNNTKDAFSINQITKTKYFFIDISKTKDEIIIIFKDNAGGIEKDAVSKVFEPYFTTKHQNCGTGIGLYMTYKIITQHFNGKIEAKNEKYTYKNEDQEGACFIIRLPLVNDGADTRI